MHLARCIVDAAVLLDTDFIEFCRDLSLYCCLLVAEEEGMHILDGLFYHHYCISELEW